MSAPRYPADPIHNPYTDRHPIYEDWQSPVTQDTDTDTDTDTDAAQTGNTAEHNDAPIADLTPNEFNGQKIRLDKWLWAARFYRTRTLAKEAIEAGRVHFGGSRVKVSKEIAVGDVLTIRQGSATNYTQKTVKVLALSDVRGNATAASRLYQETDESISQREFFLQQKKLANLARPDRRPNKKQRRQLEQLRERNHYSSDDEGY